MAFYLLHNYMDFIVSSVKTNNLGHLFAKIRMNSQGFQHTKKAQDIRRHLGLLNFNYLATGYTDTCFLSRPLRSKRTTPSTFAYNVSSPPIPTLTPG